MSWESVTVSRTAAIGTVPEAFSDAAGLRVFEGRKAVMTVKRFEIAS